MSHEDDLRLLTHALENAWPDGKRRDGLQKTMEGRLRAMVAKTGVRDLAALRRVNPGLYVRFLKGCRRACQRAAVADATPEAP